MASISPTQSNITAALYAFLTFILPPNTLVVLAADNRVTEPSQTNFVVMTPIRFERIATNIDTGADVKFTGSISGNTLTVESVAIGVLAPGAIINGPSIPPGITVGSQRSGSPGGAGVYVVNGAPPTVPVETMSCGAIGLLQLAVVTVQLDFHSGTNGSASAASDMAQTVSTVLRDEQGVNFFATLAPPLNGVVPLYADDPRYMPFINDAEQYEWRWVLEARFEADQLVSLPQQFFDSATITVESATALPD
jgi:hypothetical protein